MGFQLMPLNETDRANVLRYCDRDLEDKTQVESLFDFIENSDLRSALVREYIAARYIYKLQEALSVNNDKLAAHAKFQIVQYASIYEAVIVHVLWNYFPTRPEVAKIEFFKSLRKVGPFQQGLDIRTKEGVEVHPCIEVEVKNTQHSIKFEDKVNAAVEIGFIDENLGEEIKDIFKIRNGVHIENAVKNEIEYEIEQSQLAYWRIRPFTIGVRDFLSTGIISDAARPKTKTTPD